LTIYAKSAKEQTLYEHTQLCLKQYDKLKNWYPELFSDRDWEILYWAVRLHDMGKIDAHFQNKIRKVIGKKHIPEKGEEYPHNYLSPAFLNKKFFKEKFGNDTNGKQDYELLVKIIFYHHARESVNLPYKEDLEQYIKEILAQRWYEVQQEVNISNFDGLAEKANTKYLINIFFEDSNDDENKWLDDELQERYMKLKGMMNRIDYCASAGVNIEQELEDNDGKRCAEKTAVFMKKSGFLLHPVQQYLKEHSGQNVIVQASTGCGKTEGALLWLDGKKGFYTLPLKASINAIYKRITESIGYKKAAVLHGDAKAVYLEQENKDGVPNDEEALQKYQLARLLTAPLTVCTVDQLFRFVYKANGTEAAAAALACGNLVIDEIQMYSPELIASILYALHFISDMGGHFCIMTATFPKVLLNLMTVYKIPCPQKKKLPNFHGSVSCRHRIKVIENKQFPLEQICKQAKTKRVLVLVNRVGAAQDLKEELSAFGVEANVLHSRYLRKDRRALEQEIIEFAPNSKDREPKNGVWISTQVVEASLDIDFDVLYTELCTVDSLLQRMGRVYRGRWYDLGEEPNVYVLNNEDIGSVNHRIVDKQLYRFSLAAVQKFDGCLLQESDEQDDKAEMLDLVYDPNKNPDIINSDYYKEIKKKYHALCCGRMYDVEKNEVSFRDIKSITVMPKSIYEALQETGELAEIQNQIQQGTPQCRAAAQEKLMEYTVPVPDMGLDIDWSPAANDRRFFPHSGVCLYNGDYDFDETQKKGKGIILKFINKKQEQEDSALFF
jgi:CRISPR-associated endonuclease/helicase Cas3